MERMVIHCVKEVKEWIDPTDVLLSMSSEGMSVPNDDDGGPITDDKPGVIGSMLIHHWSTGEGAGGVHGDYR